MANGLSSYEIARSGMFVNERGLYVTGQNISNVNTPGYTRQQAMMKTGIFVKIDDRFTVGAGADISQIRQVRHSFIDNIYRRENNTLGYWESKDKTLQDVQSVLGEPMGEGLQNVMNQFWDSWQELSKAPDSLTVRALVRQRGEALVEQANHIGDQLDKLQDDLNQEIRVRIDEVNQTTSQIANLNVEILKNEITGDTANDYRDQRNLLIDKLTKMVDCSVDEMQDGEVNVTLGGYFLVTKGMQKNLAAMPDDNGGTFYIAKLQGTDLKVDIKSGTLKGLMEARGEVTNLKGSFQNGTPNTKADINIVVDTSNGNATNLSNIQSNIAKYVDELKKSGVDYNLRLVTYGGSVTANTNFGSDDTQFLNAVNNLTINAGDNSNNFSNVVDALNNITDFRQDANKIAMVFTGESIDGDEVATPDATVDSYVTKLNSSNIKTSIITQNSYFNAGSAGEASGWDKITNGTGGKLYDVNSTDYTALMQTMGADTKTTVNNTMSTVYTSNNLIVDVKKSLNALVNQMMREVNYLHKSGKTMNLPPDDQGQDFFTTVDSTLPLEMGNVKINDNLSDLDNIVAASDGTKGDNDIALKIASLRNTPIMKDVSGFLSMDDYYQTIILNVGNNGANAERILDNQQKLVQSTDTSRQQITGVSMDEEMSNMMKYQYAYNASARVINIIDDMVDGIVNKMGLVGR